MKPRTPTRFLRPLALLSLFAAGCAHAPAVQTDAALSLRRVVVYRNGVGYFERRGNVTADHVEFRVRESEVGDFLATLAVMERGGSSVRSAAFPLPREQEGAGASSGGESDASASNAHANERRTVRLSLDGQAHDLAVGYMVETPIWRPSYRLVFDAQGVVQVQAWGIVQNISGEDWNGVTLSLVTGAPVAFRSELAVPVISPRPLVTDRGEVIDAVPQSETSLAQSGQGEAQQQQPANTQPPADEPTTGDEEGAFGAAGGPTRHHANRMAPSATTRAPRRSRASAGGYAGADPDGYYQPRQPVGTPPPPPPSPVGPSMPRSVVSLAAVAVQGGVTRYDLPEPVTVPDQSATMVLLAAREVPGRRMYLFAPDPGVGDSTSHPFQVARFENRTGSMLERGPLAIFDHGAFLGEGLMDPMPDGATATVPFALERGLAVESTENTAVEGTRLLRIAREQITLERYRVTRTRYTVRNGLDAQSRVWLRHPVPAGTQVYQPPAETEIAEGTALVPADAPARGRTEVEVQVRAPFAQTVDWSSEEAAQAIEAYLNTGNPPAPLATSLREALDLRAQLVSLATRRDDVNTRREDVERNAEQTRDSLEAIRRNPRAADLRARLTARLGQLSTELDVLTRQLVELDTQIGERRIRLLEAVRAIDVDATTAPAPAPAPAPTPAPVPAPAPTAAPRR